jgi:SAM-dependent methyltransferase
MTRQQRADYRPAELDECLDTVRSSFDQFADQRDMWRLRNLGYHRELERIYAYYIPKQASVLEVGCATGDLLASLEPALGVGLDLSPKMIAHAREKYPQLMFVNEALEKWNPGGRMFDYIVLSDVLGFAFDILAFLKALRPLCHARTRIIINIHSRLWQPVLSLAESLGMKHRQPVLNWVAREDVTNLLALAGFETINTDSRILFPMRVPLLARFFNSWLAPFKPFSYFCLANVIVARLPQAPLERRHNERRKVENGAEIHSRHALSVSVICPCRNEAGNIPHIVRRLPQMGKATELIFVEGNSMDDTHSACLKARDDNPQLDISVYQQTGKGKKDAVWLGFSKAKHNVLMILDADISVPPEDLVAFFDAISSARAEFVNGSRLVYPMENKAMRFLNLIANKFFSLAFSYLLGQNVKDTLCGTKVLLKKDFEKLFAGSAYFGNFDPFGDFDLLFGASKLNLKIVDLPIRYRERIYGATQISRFKHGWMLLKMCVVGLRRLKMR